MNRIVHFELAADNMERASEFYKSVFDWQIHKWDGPMEYSMVKTGEAPAIGIDGGMYPRSQGQGMPGVVNVIDVESIDQTLEKITAGGGTIVMPKHDIPGVGLLAYCHDTEGNTFGVMQPHMMMQPPGAEAANN